MHFKLLKLCDNDYFSITNELEEHELWVIRKEYTLELLRRPANELSREIESKILFMSKNFMPFWVQCNENLHSWILYTLIIETKKNGSSPTKETAGSWLYIYRLSFSTSQINKKGGSIGTRGRNLYKLSTSARGIFQ